MFTDVEDVIHHVIHPLLPPSCRALPEVTLGSRAQSAGLMEIAVRLCLNQRQELWVPILKPQRPCIRPSPDALCPEHVDPLLSFIMDDILDDEDDDDDDDYSAGLPVKNKRVVFADSRGLSLTAVRLFSEDQDSGRSSRRPSGPPPSPRGPGAVLSEDDGCYSCTVATCCPGTRLQLDFPPPSADFQALRSRLARDMVALESCAVVTEGAVLRGTARVKNISPRKDVRVRVTFDSWQGYRDVPCAYVAARYGGPQTDIFEFSVPVPKVLDAKKRIEFCLSYLPDGHSRPFWDNNEGQNYGVLICVSSHLCQGRTATQCNY